MIYTIGFTQKTAESFFDLLTESKVDIVIDIRLNNTSQLASFAKFPDIKFFLAKIGSIDYIHDVFLAPTEDLLKSYKAKIVSWQDYEVVFEKTMLERNIEKHIEEKYAKYSNKNICLLCSEPTAEKFHRRLVAEYFKNILGTPIIHL